MEHGNGKLGNSMINWSWVLVWGIDRKSTITSTSVRNEIFANNWRSTLFDWVHSSEIQKSL